MPNATLLGSFSVESESLPFETYRQTFQGEWGGSKLTCTFKALQLQRVEPRMF
jgi:hypothetical protein